MIRSLLLAASLAAAGSPVLAQTIASQAQTILPSPSGQARQTPPIPAPRDADYPGVIRLVADLTDLDHKTIRVTQTIPVQPGHLVLQYPRFIPGNHAGTGPIQLISGVTFEAGGQRLEWVRDPVDAYAFHLDIPADVTEIEARFEWLTQPDNSSWRVVMTPQMVNLQWEKALLYPAGYDQRRITFQADMRLPAGWRYATALETERQDGDTVRFAPITLEHLADSPVFAGRHFRRIDLDPGGRSPVHLNLVADTEAALAATEPQITGFRALVDQADRLFGVRHYDRYDFLLALSNQLGGIGLEHHRSSENSAPENFFTGGMAETSFGTVSLLPHEYTHSWNGKFRRPSDELVANFNVPTQNSLMWVYEGQTEYWGEVLTGRSGLATFDQQKVVLADIAAFYENQPGRAWRPLQDTSNHNLLGYRTPNPWPSWMRGTGDYYREALLIWLDADTLIREGTNGARSLDDFARVFFGGEEGDWTPEGYDFDELVAVLNGVYPHDWAGFLRARLDAAGPDARAPLEGITRSGYRLIYTDTLTDTEKTVMSGWANDFQYSLGFNLSGNRIVGILWGSLAYQQGLGAGWDLVAVGDRTASAERLRDAVTAARGGTDPIVLVVRRGDEFRTLRFAYHDGLRYPRLERIEGRPDRLADIFKPR